jgi:hypothetical protein
MSMGSATSRRILPAKVTEAVLLFAGLLSTCSQAGCADEPRVSPWGGRAGPQLGLYAERPDLSARLAAIDQETEALGLLLSHETRATADDGTPFVLRAYVGRDRLGRRTWACRAASPFGVVLAVGPPDERGAAEPAELVRALDAGDGRVLAPPFDMDRDGAPEVVLRADDGALAVWTLSARGGSLAKVSMATKPTGVRDLGDAGIALTGTTTAPAEVGGHSLTEIAAPSGGRFSSDAPAARAFHARERDRLAAGPEGETSEAKSARVVARAFHAVRAGDDGKAVVRELEREKAPEVAIRWVKSL